jgi:hypothetical protein
VLATGLYFFGAVFPGVPVVTETEAEVGTGGGVTVAVALTPTFGAVMLGAAGIDGAVGIAGVVTAAAAPGVWTETAAPAVGGAGTSAVTVAPVTGGATFAETSPPHAQNRAAAPAAARVRTT